MNFLLFLTVILVPNLLPVLGEGIDNAENYSLEGKIRTKRKLDIAATPVPIDLSPKGPVASQSLPVPAEQEQDNVNTDERVPPSTLLLEKELMRPESDDVKQTEVERVKKQACLKTALLKSECDTPPPAKQVMRTWLARTDETHLPVAPQFIVPDNSMVPMNAKTIETLYSVRPAPPAAAYSPAYGSTAVQVPSYMPYPLMHHPIRRPLIQHTIATASRVPIPSYRPEVVYYEAPETPIYVEENGFHSTVQHADAPEETALYCMPVKSSDLAKTLANEEKSPSVRPIPPSNSVTHENIKRVDALRDEVSQLHQAAQRIVEQQEKLAKMQNDHYMRTLGLPSKGLDPLRGFHEEHARLMHNQMIYPAVPAIPALLPVRPMYREEEKAKEGAKEPSTTTSSPAAAPLAANPQKEKESPPDGSRQMGMGYGYPYSNGFGGHGMYFRSEPELMRQFGYGYGYPMMRSTTGFDAPPLFYRDSNLAPYPATDFMTRLFDHGKSVGGLQAANGPNGAGVTQNDSKSENTLSDLVIPYANVKDDPKQSTTPKAKRDHKGLVLKNKV